MEYDKIWPAITMLAVRMLKSEVFGFKKFEDYCLELDKDRTHTLMKLQLAIELISKTYDLDNECGILLIIDEINQVTVIT